MDDVMFAYNGYEKSVTRQGVYSKWLNGGGQHGLDTATNAQTNPPGAAPRTTAMSEIYGCLVVLL